MKIRLKLIQNKMKLRFSENVYFFRKWFLKRWDRFMDRGHERMTIMLIPHDEKKIFNFQISKFTISFFVVLFVIVLATSTYAYIKNNQVKRDEKILLKSYKNISSVLLKLEKITHDIDNTVDEIKPDIEELYELSAGSENKTHLWTMDEDSERLTNLKKLENVLPSEVFLMNTIQKDLQCSINTMRTVKKFIQERKRIIDITPSDIPNQGHITSLFGWRRNPFGHDRDFHTGIDIAASRGTVIRATAPGTVVAAGWSGGYGNVVQISHEYGFQTIYGHCDTVAVKVKDRVAKGQIIGYVGQTGNATGNHCHYEVRLGDMPINPYPYMSRIW